LTLASSLENQIHAGVGGRPGIWCSASTGVSRVSASAWSASSMALWLLDVLPGGYVVSSGVFTAEARLFAKRCPIELIDAQGLGSLIGEVAAKRTEEGARVGPRKRPAVRLRGLKPLPSYRTAVWRWCGGSRRRGLVPRVLGMQSVSGVPGARSIV
jgi:hypothetical protein